MNGIYDHDYRDKHRSDVSVSFTEHDMGEHGPFEVINDSPEMKRSLISFVPQHIQLAPPVGLPRMLEGCCMVADISGFTRLSSSLCSEGLSGIDKLRRITDKSFNRFVDIVYSHHGDVIEFAGDALLCLFLPRNDNQDVQPAEWRDCCTRAVRCALDISRCRIEDTLTHVAVSAGTVSLALLGGYNDKYTCVMNGDCIDVLGEGLEMAGAQEVVVTRQVFDHIKQEMNGRAIVPASPSSGYATDSNKHHYFYRVFDRKSADAQSKLNRALSSQSLGDPSARVSVTIRDSGNVSSSDASTLPLNRCSERDILNCVPLPVIEAVATNTFAHLSELRTVTTLFVKLDTYSTSAFRDVSNLQSFFLRMQKCLDDCGGLLRQFLIDDKGCVLIGLWGVPTASYPGNCSRAVRCAVMMTSEASHLGHSLSIGITTGRVYCGVVGTTYRRDYVAIGKSVNLSARLMCKAAGRILLDHATVQKLPLDISRCALPVEGLVMKGIGNTDKYYCYISCENLPPTASDVLSDRVIMIPTCVRGMASSAVDIVRDRLEVHTESIMSWDPCSYSEANEIKGYPYPADVFLVKGVPGAGKTAALNHFVRRINDLLEYRMGVNEVSMRPLFVCLRLSDSECTFIIISKIIKAVWSCPNYSSLDKQKMMICDFMRTVYPNVSAAYLKSEIFPVIVESLALTWDFPLDLFASPSLDHHSADEPVTSVSLTVTDILVSLVRYVLAVTKPTAVVLDNVHLMSSTSWIVLTNLCSIGCSTVFVMSINVREVYDSAKLDTQDHAAAMAEKSVSLYFERASESVDYYDDSMGKCMVFVSDYPEFNRFCETVGQVHLREILLRPLSPSDIVKLITRELSVGVDAASRDAISKIADVSQGNPFLLWKVIEYAKESNFRDIDTLADSIDDNSLIIFMMNRTSQRQRMILKAASIIGDTFDIAILEEILPGDMRYFVLSACVKLAKRGLLVELSHANFSFSSPLLRKFVYDLVPPSDRNKMHGLIADALAFRYREDLQTNVYSLSYHFSLSDFEGHKQLAFQCSCSAAENLIQCNAIEVILQYLEAARMSAVCFREYLRLYRILSRTTDALTRKLSVDSNESSVVLLQVILRSVGSIKKSVREEFLLYPLPSLCRRIAFSIKSTHAKVHCVA